LAATALGKVTNNGITKDLKQAWDEDDDDVTSTGTIGEFR